MLLLKPEFYFEQADPLFLQSFMIVLPASSCPDLYNFGFSGIVSLSSTNLSPAFGSYRMVLIKNIYVLILSARHNDLEVPHRSLCI